LIFTICFIVIFRRVSHKNYWFYTCNKTVRGTLIQLTEFVNETLTKIVQYIDDAINTVRTKKVRKLLGQTEYIIQNYAHTHTRTCTRTRIHTQGWTLLKKITIRYTYFFVTFL